MDAILVRHDRDEVRRHFHPHFVQHNPWAADGGAHVEEMCDFEFGVEMRRWLVQGDIVAYHGLYTAPNPLGEHPLLCVDLWRIAGDQIVEHWDVLAPTPAGTIEQLLGGAGDGTLAVDAATCSRNAFLARRLLELGRGDTAVVDDCVQPDVVLHRSDVNGTGREALREMFGGVAHLEVKRTVASGDLVLVQVARRMRDREEAGYEIMRFDGETVAETWSVFQDRVPLKEAANPHPHF